MNPRRETHTRIRGLYGMADAGTFDDPVRLGALLLEGGCRLVQLRCKGWALPDIECAAQELAARCRAVGATFLVNDHPEIAAAVDADGVHVGQTDADAPTVRRVLGDARILGRSTNDLAQLEVAMRHADYVAFGPVFATANLSRPKQVRGLAALVRARQIVGQRMPLVAIGGIDPHNLESVREAGPDAWAVISAISGSKDVVASVRALLA